MNSPDLRSFLQFIEEKLPRESLRIADDLNPAWELAAITTALQDKMRMPVITYEQVADTPMAVVHNVCASLARIAKESGLTQAELESLLDSAYDNLLPPIFAASAPVREVVFEGSAVDLKILPALRYTETETSGYLSAAHVVALDPLSGSHNISFHRMMIHNRNTLAIYMTRGAHLSQIHECNAKNGADTPIAVFIGAHPLWSLGSLAAGALDLDEFEVIGGLLGQGLDVTQGLIDSSLIVPAAAEIVLEGSISCSKTIDEGPYGEAFGFVSQVQKRPLVEVKLISHRKDPLFQDIVPSKLEHLTMTGIAVQVHLRKALLEQFSCIQSVFLPTPMTVYISLVEPMNKEIEMPIHRILKTILNEQRFVKLVVIFDHDVDTSNNKQTQRALSTYVQADRDLVILPGLPGNGLDPSERNELTTKWGIDARCVKPGELDATTNKLPADVVAGIDLGEILKRAKASATAAQNK